jgi:hypothetical protein
MQVARRAPHVHGERHNAPHADRQCGRHGVVHVRIKDDGAIGPPLVGREPVLRTRSARFFLSLDQTSHVDGKPVALRKLARSEEQGIEVALVVARAARIDAVATDLRLEWRCRPRVDGIGRLDVVVTVDEHGWRRGVGRSQLADRQRIAKLRHDLRVAARALDLGAKPLGGGSEIRRVPSPRRDRGDAEIFEDLVQQLWRHRRHAGARPPRSGSTEPDGSDARETTTRITARRTRLDRLWIGDGVAVMTQSSDSAESTDAGSSSSARNFSIVPSTCTVASQR